KGDYFGPLAVVCAYMSAAQAREAAARGVTDSKGISDGRCLALAEYLRSELDGQWSRVVIGPDRYNRTYSQMKRRGENLNDLLARAHARCIRDLAGRTGSGSLTVLVDRFAREDLLLSHLDSPRHLEVRQVERGERDLAVAAASILARAEFLRALEALSKTVGVVLPKGAGDATVATAERIVRMHGWRSLFRVAKLHFANTGKIDLGGSAHGK
ncbi:MAG: ribonuclease HIII, partial [Bacillota bacterium]